MNALIRILFLLGVLAVGCLRLSQAVLSITVDYYEQLWLNGERVLVCDGPHPRLYFMPLRLKAGVNEFFLKAAAGSGGHSFELCVARVSIRTPDTGVA